MRPSPRPRTDELLSIQIIARSIKCTRKKGRRGERKGKERRVCAYVNVARRPSVRKSHWPFREITWTAKLPRNIANAASDRRKREARRGERKINWTTCQFSNRSTNRPFFFFFFRSKPSFQSIQFGQVTFVTCGIIIVDNCYKLSSIKCLKIGERRNSLESREGRMIQF